MYYKLTRPSLPQFVKYSQTNFIFSRQYCFLAQGESVPKIQNIFSENFVQPKAIAPRHLNERLVSVDGINLNIREEGDGDHHVLCLPGLLGTIETDFGLIFKKMNKSKFRLICFDPPGYGESRPYKKSHKGDFYARDARIAAKLMHELGYNKFSIIGWSNGGMTGNALAAKFPDRVSHLVMLASHAYCDEDVIARGLYVTNPNCWVPSVLKEVFTTYDESYVEEILTDYAACSREFYSSGQSVKLGRRCSQIICPTLVFHGEKDPLISIKHAQYFRQNIKNCKMHIVKGGKHNLHMTHVQYFLNLVEPFLLNAM